MSRRSTIVLATAVLASCLCGGRSIAGDGLLPVPGFGRSQVRLPSRDGGTAGEEGVSLRFVGATWPTVFRRIAEQSGKELVMPEFPLGRFTRLDGTPVSPEAALRIVNQELEGRGVRAMFRGGYLIVLRDETFRTRFARNTYASDDVTPDTPSLAAHDGRPMPPDEPPAAGPPSTVLQAGFETPAGGGDDGEASNGPSASVAPRSVTAVEPRNRGPSLIAADVRRAFGPRAEPARDLIMGLPTLRIAGNETQVFARLAVDDDLGRLLIDASPEKAEALVTLIDAFDRPSAATQPTVVPASDVRLGVAERLPPILAQVTDPSRGDRGTTTGDDAVPTPDATGDGPEDLTSILDRLRGDVSIESIDALGLLVLRGNEADVDAVLRVIRGIESMSVGATPEIHLRRLAHVSGESLAGLLNDVYAGVRGIERRSDRADAGVSFIPVVQPNAVVIVTPSRDLPSVLELIDELDAPLDPAAEVEVFRLKNANASSAVTVLQEFYAERGGLGARLRVATDPRTNTLIVQARPNDLAEIRRVVENLDSGLSASVSRLRLFALERAVASEVADFLNTAIDQVLDARSVGPSEPEPKAVILEFFADEGAELIRSGVLADVRVSADPRTNAVAVVAPERSMPLFEALIAKLDAVSAAAEEIKVFQLQRADATSAAELLTTLFEQSGDSPAGVALPGGGDAGSVLLPLRFTVDVRTNSIIARGGRDALTIAEAILLRLDVGDARSRVDKVFRLKNAPAADIAEAINEFLESQFELTQIDPNLVSTVELLERDVIVVPEPVSNSLLISATPSYYDELEPLIKDLDAAPPQVIIQGLIVEVDLDDVDEFGIELGFQDSILFDRSNIVADSFLTVTETITSDVTSITSETIVNQEGNPGFLFNNPTLFPQLGNNVTPTVGSSVVGEQALANFGVGRVNGDLGFGGLVLSASSEAVSVLIRALAQKRSVHILSRPQIRTLDGQLAQIQVGQVVPIVNGVNVTVNGTNPNIEQDEAGIILTVTPRINADRQIVMEVVAEKSAFDTSEGVPIFTDVTTGAVITSPVKNVTVARSTVSVANNQTIVMGGMITKTDDTLERKVPWLGDVPLIGKLFRFDSVSRRRTELLIFLTPRIIDGDADSELINEVESGRLNFFYEEAEELHGPIFAVPVDEVRDRAAGHTGVFDHVEAAPVSGGWSEWDMSDVPVTEVVDESLLAPAPGPVGVLPPAPIPGDAP